MKLQAQQAISVPRALSGQLVTNCYSRSQDGCPRRKHLLDVDIITRNVIAVRFRTKGATLLCRLEPFRVQRANFGWYICDQNLCAPVCALQCDSNYALQFYPLHVRLHCGINSIVWKFIHSSETGVLQVERIRRGDVLFPHAVITVEWPHSNCKSQG